MKVSLFLEYMRKVDVNYWSIDMYKIHTLLSDMLFSTHTHSYYIIRMERNSKILNIYLICFSFFWLKIVNLTHFGYRCTLMFI